MATFELVSGAIPPGAKTIGFDAREELGRPFSVEVFVTIEDAGAVELMDLIGAPGSLYVDLPEQGRMAFHGHLSAFSLLRMEGKLSLYKATITPRMSALAESKHSRVFTKLALKDIVTQVLGEYGLAAGEDFEFRLVDPPPAEEHVSQYKESDLDFIHRWMEREGWTYFFDHEGSSEKMVIVDSKTAHESLRSEAVRYFPQNDGDGTTRNTFREVARKSSATPGRVRIKDYDYMKPAVDVAGTATVSPQGLGELTTYGARVFEPDAATRLARIRSEELLARALTYHALGAAAHVRAGYTFELWDHPRASMNKAYLATTTRHVGMQPSMGEPWGSSVPKMEHADVYTIEVGAIETDRQFRNASTTPWPRVDGFENALVDGAASSPYAQIDADGRYLLKFHYDESPNKDGTASTRVRMAQPHGGSTEGFHFPLRKGTEIICAFLGGDPDRPVIVGVVPNAEKASKVVGANHTQNIVQTGSGNFITAEDQQGAEWLNIFSPAGGNQANLYLGNPRGDGPFGLTSQCAPDTPVSGRNAVDLGPYSAQLWTAGSVEVCAGANLNFIAGAQMQVRAHGGEYRTYSQGPWFLDAIGAAKETYMGTLDYYVKGTTKITLEDTENTHVVKPASYTHNNTLYEKVTGKVTEKYGSTKKQDVVKSDMECVGGDRKFTRKTYDSTINDGDDQFVLGNQTLTSNAGETITVSGPKTEKTGGNVELTVNGNMTWEMSANTFTARYNAGFNWDAKVFRGEYVTGTKESTFNGLNVEIWSGNRASLAWSTGFEIHKVKIAITASEAHAFAIRAIYNRISLSFNMIDEELAAGPKLVAFPLYITIHALKSKT